MDVANLLKRQEEERRQAEDAAAAESRAREALHRERHDSLAKRLEEAQALIEKVRDSACMHFRRLAGAADRRGRFCDAFCIHAFVRACVGSRS